MIERTTLYKTLLGLVLLGAGAGCSSGNDTTGDEGGGELHIFPLSRATTSGGLTVDTAELSFRTVSLEPCTPNAALLNTRDFSIDLFHAPPASILFVSAVTDFCGSKIELGPATSADLPELVGATARFQGVRDDGTPFTLTSTLDTSLEFQTDAAFDANHLVLGVDLDAWFANADVAHADASDTGVLIDADDNPDVLGAFDAATGSALGLYVDANADDSLTGSELDSVAPEVQP